MKDMLPCIECGSPGGTLEWPISETMPNGMTGYLCSKNKMSGKGDCNTDIYFTAEVWDEKNDAESIRKQSFVHVLSWITESKDALDKLGVLSPILQDFHAQAVDGLRFLREDIKRLTASNVKVEPPCPHAKTSEASTGCGIKVEFCLDCGTSIHIGKPVMDEIS